MRFIGFIIGLVVLLLIAGAIYTGFGFYDVSARRPDNPTVAYWLSRTSDSSIRRHADESVPFPPPLDDPAMIQAGAEKYVEEGCIDCHGGVGVAQAEFTGGMDPEPPELVEAAVEWDDRELFWVVQNGIRMTGMPAFGGTHDAQALWSIVAFVRQMPKMSEEDFAKLIPSMEDHLDRKGEDEEGEGSSDAGAAGTSAEKPTAEGGSAQPAAETRSDQSGAEKSAEGVGEQPGAEKPADGSVSGQPVTEQPAAEAPASDAQPKATTGSGG